MSEPARRAASVEAFLAIPEGQRFHELIAGEIIEKAAPSGEHGDAQAVLLGTLVPPFRRPPGQGGPGGWWIQSEVEVELDTGDIVRPDAVGWRRERCPDRPTGTPIKLRPDWVCEIVSASHANDDTIKKLRLYHRAKITHYWLADPRDMTLTVLRWSEPGYVTVQRAERGEVVRAEPFQAVEIAVGTLFGDDPA
jgi:Uma2 family endonuclease